MWFKLPGFTKDTLENIMILAHILLKLTTISFSSKIMLPTTKMTIGWFQEQGLTVVDWPPQSPVS